MALIIPDFKGSECLGIVACGEIDDADPDALALIDRMNDRTLLANYKAADGTDSMLRLSFGGESDRHLHLDAFKRLLFPLEVEGEILSLEELTAYFNPFGKQKISGRFYGRFILPIKELPKNGIISSTLFEREEEEISIKTNAAKFEIKGAPVNFLQWSLIDEDSRIMIDIEGFLSETIGDDYLVKQLDLIDSAFQIFVRGGKRNVGD